PAGRAGGGRPRSRDRVGWSHAAHPAPRPVVSGRPFRLRLALPAGGGSAGIARAPGRTGRPHAGLRPGSRLPWPGRVPWLVRQRPAGVRHHPAGGHPRVPAGRTGAGHLAGDGRAVPAPPRRGPGAGAPADTGAPRGRLPPPPPPAAPPALTANGRPPPRDLPAQPGRRWLAGDLHTHTVHSDGGLTVPELALLAAGSGLDFLAITDHPPPPPPPPLPPPPPPPR